MGSLSLNPLTCAPGDTVSFTATQAATTGASYTVSLDGAIVKQGRVGALGPGGTFSGIFTVPSSTPIGSHTVTFRSQVTPVSATLTVGSPNTASISVSPSTAGPGAEVTLNGSGFVGFRKADFLWNGELFTSAIIPGGSWSTKVKVNANHPPGPVTITVTQTPYGSNRYGSTQLTVLAGAPSGEYLSGTVHSAAAPNVPFTVICTVRNEGLGSGQIRVRLFMNGALRATAPPRTLSKDQEANFSFLGISAPTDVDIVFKIDTMISGTTWTETDVSESFHVTISPDIGTIVLELDKPVGAQVGKTVTFTGSVKVNGSAPNLIQYQAHIKVLYGLSNVLMDGFVTTFSPNGDFSFNWAIPANTSTVAIDAELQLFLDKINVPAVLAEKKQTFRIAGPGDPPPGEGTVVLAVDNIQGNFLNKRTTIGGTVTELETPGPYRLHVQVFMDLLGVGDLLRKVVDTYVTPDQFSKWQVSFTASPSGGEGQTNARLHAWADPIPYQGSAISDELVYDFLLRPEPVTIKFGDGAFDPKEVLGHVGDQSTLSVEYGAFLQNGLPAHAYVETEIFNKESGEWELLANSVRITPDELSGGLSFNKTYELTFALTEEMEEGQSIKFRVSCGSYDKVNNQIISIDDTKTFTLQIGAVTALQWLSENWWWLAVIGGVGGAGVIAYKVVGGKSGLQRLIELKILGDLAKST